MHSLAVILEFSNMSDHDSTIPKAEGAAASVQFTEREYRDLVEAVGAAVSDLLQMPVRVGFNAEDSAFLIEITGTVPEALKN